MSGTKHAFVQALRASLGAQTTRRALLFDVTWLTIAALTASLEVRRDPLTAWEHVLYAMLGLMVPVLALRTALTLVDTLTNPTSATALAARHGANRRHGFAIAGALAILQAVLLTNLGLLLAWVLCRGPATTFWHRDLFLCCGLGTLATVAYIAYAAAATRLGLGRAGAWMAVGMDLTLGHVSAGWAVVFPHRHVVNLIGYPGYFSLSPRASSWILFAFVLVGLTYTTRKTPR